ncbi:GntR family transcriptional regulator [Arthrobacter sp. Br18]|uniref:GntR family transcriptional regulator n=1 Tax=Arthrobacter sp. Br18 TaxID=1312954 RepID=UPI00047DBCAC|nr:GntR family transcriptional regulator [Arthrobacter sp. Br18]
MPTEWRSSVSLVDQTAELIRERIFTGYYPPGVRLPQALLSSELGISRTPLREGLRILEQEGLVIASAGGVATVFSPGIGEMREIFELREALEGMSVRLACSRVTPGILSDLHQVVADQHRAQESGQSERFHRLGLHFHTLLLDASGNSRIRRQLSVVRLGEQLLGGAGLMTTDAARAALREHAAIVDAIRDSDPGRAEQASLRHLQSDLLRLSRSRGVAA